MLSEITTHLPLPIAGEDPSDAGGIWYLNVQVGLGNPPLPVANLDLASAVTTMSGGSGSLRIELSQDNLTEVFPGYHIHWGGTIKGSGLSAQLWGFVDDNNALFGDTTLIGTLGPITPPPPQAFSADIGSPVSVESPYSLTLRLILTAENASAGVVYTGDALITPEPSAILLIGIGLASLGWFAGRRKK